MQGKLKLKAKCVLLPADQSINHLSFSLPLETADRQLRLAHTHFRRRVESLQMTREHAAQTDHKKVSSSPSSFLEDHTTKMKTNGGGIERRWRMNSFFAWTFQSTTLTTLLPLNFLLVMMVLLISTLPTEAVEFDIEKLQEYNSLVRKLFLKIKLRLILINSLTRQAASAKFTRTLRCATRKGQKRPNPSRST